MTDILIYVRSDSLGEEPEFGLRLMQSFWNSLGERLEHPLTVAFINRGVLLVLEGSPVLQSLRALEREGCRFLACGTCLDYYEAKNRIAVGEIGSMAKLQELMLSAHKVITL